MGLETNAVNYMTLPILQFDVKLMSLQLKNWVGFINCFILPLMPIVSISVRLANIK